MKPINKVLLVIPIIISIFFIYNINKNIKRDCEFIGWQYERGFIFGHCSADVNDLFIIGETTINNEVKFSGNEYTNDTNEPILIEQIEIKLEPKL